MIIGIDPGFSGAIAFIGANRKLLRVDPMPLMGEGLVFTPKDERRNIDSHALALLLNHLCQISTPFPPIVVLEAVASSPKMGVTSAFRFGEGFGLIKGILAASGVKPKLVSPSSWKPAMGLSSDKKMSLTLAAKLFPEWGSKFGADRSSADLAEAALLAKFGEKFLRQA
jgi:crossover junction endodeoxyribonuclease RuvC